MAFLDKTGLERLWLHILSKTNQTLASAKQYADDIKNDLLNGAGGAYDTLKELGDLIDENADAIDAIERLADTKSDKGHIHDDRYYTEAEIDKTLKFVKEASGEVITVNDSAEQSLVGLKLYGKTTQVTTTGKNLLPYPYAHGSNTNAGITFTINDDGSVTASGTATAQARFIFHLLDAGSRVYLPAGKYTFSGNPDPNISMAIYLYSDNTTSEFLMWKDISNGSTYTFELSEPAYYGAYCVISAGATVNATVKPILEAGSAATSYEPYTGGIPSPNPDYPQPLVSPGDGGSIEVKAMGKNLWSLGDIIATEYAIEISKGFENLVPNMQYTLTWKYSSNGTTDAQNAIIVYTDVGNIVIPNGTSFTITEAHFRTLQAIYAYFGSDASSGSMTDIMLNEGSVAIPFEPYKDGGSLTVSTPNGLPGIPVTSGGNYTDANGQMWICDEIDLERGMYVERIGKKVVTAAEVISSQYNYANVVYYAIAKQNNNANLNIALPLQGMCDKFANGTVPTWDSADGINRMLTHADYLHDWFGFAPGTTLEEAQNVMTGMTVLYILSAPIETPLSEAELSAYRAMTSQKPNTTVYNDAGANMTVEYADIKIDDIEKALNLPEINAALAEKVDKVAGKGLSTNDFTTAEKEKLSRLSETSNIEVDSELSDNSENPVQNKVINDALKFLKKSSGNIVTITDGAEHPAIELISHIEPVQAGSGDPSSSNVRPINGWDAVGITRTGKNLFGGDALADKLVSVISATKDTAAGTISFSASKATGQEILTGVFKPNTQYTFVFYGNNTNPAAPLNLRIVYSDGTDTTPVFSEPGKNEQRVIYSEQGKTVEKLICVYWDGLTTLYYNQCGVFEGVIEAAQFEPYQGQTLTASLPETVYGGTLNWTTGILTVPRKKDIINAAESVYSVSDTLIIGTVSKSDMLQNSRNNGLCDALPSANTIFGISSPCIVFGINDTVIYFVLPVDRAGTTLETLNAYLAANPLTIMYPLATPYTIQLTPQQLFTLHGTNNVWSDCGETELTYATIRTDEIEKVLIDPTLSIKGAAAEAKTVGDILNSQYSVKRETGDIISVDTIEGLAIHPTTYIEFIQSGSGDPSPDNVRPISGWDSVAVQRTGKNICPGYKIGAYINNSGVYTDAYLTYRCTELIRVSGGETLVEQHGGTAVREACHCYNSEKKWLGTADINNRPAGTAYIAINYMGDDLQWVQVEVGNTATAYEPYQGQTLTATLPETIYGGTLDWTKGEMTVTHYKLTFDGVTTGAKLDNTDPGVTTYAYIVAANMPRPLEWYSTAYANRLKSVGTNTVIAFGLPTELTGVTGGDDTLTVTAKYNAVLKQWYDAGEPLEIVYKLATPYTIQLTPQELSTIEGQNNIWSNAGKTEALINLTPIDSLKNISSIIGSKLDKTTYEYNKELALSYSGKVCIGKFPAYDSNISVEIKSTTDIAYNGTLIIATQNINTTGGGGYSATVYGDATNILTNSIKIHYGSGSNVFSVYIDLPSWSKNLLHIQCVSLAGTPTDIATEVSSIPSNATIVPVNALKVQLDSKATKEELKASTADWNQNDPNAADYVKNRTHWVEDEEILPKTTVAIHEMFQGQTSVTITGTFVNGNTYDIIYNGKVYSVIAQVAYGCNFSTNDFMIGFMSNTAITIFSFDGSSTATISISGYVDNTYTEMLSEITVPLQSTGQHQGAIAEPFTGTIIVDNIYNVYYNGTTYSITATNQNGYLYLTNDIFNIAVDPNGAYTPQIMVADGSTEATISINDIIIHKLDNKFINIDTELDSESTNPVQNKAIKAYIEEVFLGGAW